jgi:hypothetical protein
VLPGTRRDRPSPAIHRPPLPSRQLLEILQPKDFPEYFAAATDFHLLVPAFQRIPPAQSAVDKPAQTPRLQFPSGASSSLLGRTRLILPAIPYFRRRLNFQTVEKESLPFHGGGEPALPGSPLSAKFFQQKGPFIFRVFRSLPQKNGPCRSCFKILCPSIQNRGFTLYLAFSYPFTIFAAPEMEPAG